MKSIGAHIAEVAAEMLATRQSRSDSNAYVCGVWLHLVQRFFWNLANYQVLGRWTVLGQTDKWKDTTTKYVSLPWGGDIVIRNACGKIGHSSSVGRGHAYSSESANLDWQWCKSQYIKLPEMHIFYCFSDHPQLPEIWLIVLKLPEVRQLPENLHHWLIPA